MPIIFIVYLQQLYDDILYIMYGNSIRNKFDRINITHPVTNTNRYETTRISAERKERRRVTDPTVR